MPPALPDSRVGWASGPAGAERKRHNTNGALETLLVDLGSQIRLGLSDVSTHSDTPPDRHPDTSPETSETPSGPRRAQELLEAPHVCSTGLSHLDARLGGGFPRGRLSEICGPPSSGRTALALSLVHATLQRGGLTSWIDLADTFDPISAAASGIALERLLWVRPRSEKEALQSCDRLLQTEGFELVVFDCMTVGHSTRDELSHWRMNPRERNRPTRNRAGRRDRALVSISDVAWLRLSRMAAKTNTALVVLSQQEAQREAQKEAPKETIEEAPDFASPPSLTSSRAAILLEMLPFGAHFVGSPSLLDSLETRAILRRHYRRPSGAEIPFSIHANSER